MSNTVMESGIGNGEPTGTPRHGFLERLYTGTGGFRIVSRRRLFYTISVILLLISLASIAVRGFTLGIDFAGGSRIQLPAEGTSTEQVEKVYSDTLGHGPVTVQRVGSGATATIQVRSETLDPADADLLQNALFQAFQPKDPDGNPSPAAISIAEISETWGGQITRQAVIALVVFVLLAMLYIALRFERDMSIAAITSLFFNLIVTAGVYSLVGFEVTPAAVIGLLTILGFSLYDNVVVFDKVEENTRGVTHTMRRTYAEQANLAANQTLMRSLSTTIIGVLPILGLLVIAVWMLGVGTLKDLALVQMVGMIVATYSSVFFAVPVLVSIKERFGPVAAHTKKVLAKRSGVMTTRVGSAAAQRAGAASRPVAAREASAPRSRTSEGPRPGARPSGKRHKRRH
ncbi:protein translocase subunit SecF [Nocardia sp. CC227C]|uniref:protein translocase subunit SecF n=1 Tax=Nocardia sp. CC227C TaxID=3044562 RepID=UPI00278C7E27|nr:protein translocase subunit SecF [Nocardia sp. CC227C]